MNSLPPPPPFTATKALPPPPPINMVPQVSYSKLSGIKSFNQDNAKVVENHVQKSDEKSSIFHSEVLKILKTTNSEAALAAVRALSIKVPKLETSVYELQNQNDDYKEQLRKVSYIQSQQQQIQIKNEQFQSKIKQLQEQVKLLTQSNSSKQSTESTMKQLKCTQLATVDQKDVQQLRLELETVTAEKKMYRTSYHLVSKMNSKLQTQSNQIRMQLFEHTGNLVNFTNFLNEHMDSDVLFDPNTCLNVVGTTIRNKLQQCDNVDLNVQLNQFKELYQNEYKTTQLIKQDKSTLQDFIQSIKNIFIIIDQCDLENLIQKIQEVYDSEKSLKQTCNLKQEQIDIIEELNTEIYNKLDALQLEITKLQSQNSTLIEQNVDFNQKLSQKDVVIPQYPDLSHELFEQQQEFIKLNQANQQLIEKINVQNAQIEFQESENAQLSTLLTDVKQNSFNSTQELHEDQGQINDLLNDKHAFIDAFNTRLNQLILSNHQPLIEQIDNIFLFINQDDNQGSLNFSDSTLTQSSQIFGLLSTVSKQEIRTTETALAFIQDHFEQNLAEQNKISEMVFQMQQLTSKNEFQHQQNTKNYQREINTLHQVIQQQEFQVNECVNQLNLSKFPLQKDTQLFEIDILKREIEEFQRQNQVQREVIQVLKQEKLAFVQTVNSTFQLSKLFNQQSKLQEIASYLQHKNEQKQDTDANFQRKYENMKYSVCEELNLPSTCSDTVLIKEVIRLKGLETEYDIEKLVEQVNSLKQINETQKQVISELQNQQVEHDTNIHISTLKQRQTTLSSLCTVGNSIQLDSPHDTTEFLRNMQKLTQSISLPSFDQIYDLFRQIIATNQSTQQQSYTSNSTNVHSLLQKKDTKINLLNHQITSLQQQNQNNMATIQQLQQQIVNFQTVHDRAKQLLLQTKQQDIFAALNQLISLQKKNHLQGSQLENLKRKIEMNSNCSDIKNIFEETACQNQQIRLMRNCMHFGLNSVNADSLRVKKLVEFVGLLRENLI